MEERIGRIEQIETDFFDFLLKIRAFGSKNPFQSAQSAQSVLPFVSLFSKVEIAV
jgi:hypothetical protein